MSAVGRQYIGWRLCGVPVHEGARPENAVSLRELSDAAEARIVVETVAHAFDLGVREAALTVAHFAVGVMCSTVLSVMAFDGVALSIAPEQLGLALGADGTVTEVWVGEVDVAESAWASGRSVWSLLSPVGEVVRRIAGVGAVAMDLVLFEAVELEVRRLERLRLPGPYEGWGADVMDGLGFVPHIDARELTVSADAGPDITLPVRRVCCVLLRRPTEHACPSCPQFSAEERAVRTREWLHSLDRRDFTAVTGRARVETAAPAKAQRRRRT